MVMFLIQETEEFISNLVVSKTIFARIDRPTGIVNFIKNCEPDVKLNDWSKKTRNLMGLISKTTYMITREEMLKAKGNNLMLSDWMSIVITVLLVCTDDMVIVI